MNINYGNPEIVVLTTFYQNKIKHKIFTSIPSKQSLITGTKASSTAWGKKVVFYFQYREEHLQAIDRRSEQSLRNTIYIDVFPLLSVWFVSCLFLPMRVYAVNTDLLCTTAS